jgi:hypothetical protein
VTGDGGLYSAVIRLARNSFHLSLPFFHLSFTNGKEVAFMYHLANLLAFFQY